ncbi:MAG: hypothetical protein CW338_08755 [Clostridiales bacterium]|nr:hypothetical protein [Clostridiales bacterium]
MGIDYRVLYFAQLNTLCILLLVIVLFRLRNRRETVSARRRAFLRMVWVAIALCVSDVFSGLCNNGTFSGAQFLNEASNIIYYLGITWIGYIWMVFVNMRLNGLEYNHKRMMILSSIPLFAISLVILLNPFIHFMFTVDPVTNEYQRGPGVYLHWIVSWGYLFAAEINVLLHMKKLPGKTAKRKLVPLLWFIAAPIVAAVVQMVVPMLNENLQCTTMQCGITFSIVVMTFEVLREKISMDSLTGLNNRSAFENYISDNMILGRNKLRLIMSDVDHFKNINDVLGHLMGDLALKSVSDVLKTACNKQDFNVFLCRYGGDEFVIASTEASEEDMNSLIRDISEGLGQFNSGSRNVFMLEISIGQAFGRCDSFEDAEALIKQADDQMYEQKKAKKAQRT